MTTQLSGVHEIIERCQRAGIQLSLNGTKLRVMPASKVTPELKAALLQHKPEILRLLPSRQVQPVFTYYLANNPHQQLLMMGYRGETLAEARASLFDRFGPKVLSIEPYQWTPIESTREWH